VRRLSFLAMVAGLLFVSMTTDVYAYLDPVVGSFLLQGLISGVVAAVVTFRSVRDRIFQIFRARKRSED
jgi:hypothetical protein